MEVGRAQRELDQTAWWREKRSGPAPPAAKRLERHVTGRRARQEQHNPHTLASQALPALPPRQRACLAAYRKVLVAKRQRALGALQPVRPASPSWCGALQCPLWPLRPAHDAAGKRPFLHLNQCSPHATSSSPGRGGQTEAQWGSCGPNGPAHPRQEGPAPELDLLEAGEWFWSELVVPHWKLLQGSPLVTLLWERDGIPDNLRGQVWPLCIGNAQRLDRCRYHRYAQDLDKLSPAPPAARAGLARFVLSPVHTPPSSSSSSSSSFSSSPPPPPPLSSSSSCSSSSPFSSSSPSSSSCCSCSSSTLHSISHATGYNRHNNRNNNNNDNNNNSAHSCNNSNSAHSCNNSNSAHNSTMDHSMHSSYNCTIDHSAHNYNNINSEHNCHNSNSAHNCTMDHSAHNCHNSNSAFNCHNSNTAHNCSMDHSARNGHTSCTIAGPLEPSTTTTTTATTTAAAATAAAAATTTPTTTTTKTLAAGATRTSLAPSLQQQLDLPEYQLLPEAAISRPSPGRPDLGATSTGKEDMEESWPALAHQQPPSLLSKEQEGWIRADVTRMFPGAATHEAFHVKGSIYQDLRAVLQAFCQVRPEISYVQGLSYLANLLLLYMSPDIAWLCLVNLCSLDFFEPYLEMRMADIRLRFQLWELMLLMNSRRLHQHFAALHLYPDAYLMEWMLTLFAKQMTPKLVARVWDGLFLHGEVYMFKTGCAVLKLLEGKLLRLGTRAALQLLTGEAVWDFPAPALVATIRQVRVPCQLQRMYQRRRPHPPDGATGPWS